MIKKILITFSILIMLILASAVILPIVFKDKIISLVKTEANKNLNAKVDFGAFDLTLFHNFPDFTLIINNIKVEGIDEFEGISLADIASFETTIDIKSVLSGGQIKIKSFGLTEPVIHASVLKSGKANWDIAKPSGEPAKPEAPSLSEPAKFNLSLQKYYIEKANILYKDSSLNIFTELVNFSHSGSGDFTQDIFMLKTITTADKFTFVFDGVPYLSKVKTYLKIDLDMDMPNMKFVFKENEIQINELFLGIDGSIEMPKDDIAMDIKFFAKKTEFKNILSLIPAVFTRDFEKVKTTGKLALDATVKGVYNDKTIPGFALNLSVDEASFKYPDLPKSVEKIFVRLNVTNPGGNTDLTVVDLSKFHAELAGNPIDMRLKVKTPVSDADIDATVKTQINLSNLKDVLPMQEGESYQGSITADMVMKGRVSAIEKQQYEQFKATGQLILLDMAYKSKDVPYGMNISKAYFNFSPQFVDMTALEVKIGKSDVKASGKIENFLAYYFRDDALRGRFDMSSSLLDLNEFISKEEPSAASPAPAEATSDTSSSQMSVVEVPGNIDFIMTTAIGKLLYDNMEMAAIAGGLTIKDKVVTLQTLKLNTLEGQLTVSGSYNTQKKNFPMVDFDMDISRFDLQKTFKTFNTMQKLAPIAESGKGKFSTAVKFRTLLDATMQPVMSTLNGSGKLQTHNILITNSGVLGQLAEKLKMDAYKTLSLNDVFISFQFADGKVKVEPFSIAVGNSKATISGWSGFDQTLGYTLNMDVPTSELGAGMGAVSGLLSAFNSKAGTNVKAPATVKADVLVGGTVSKPTVKLEFKGFGSEGGDGNAGLKDQAKEVFDAKKAELEQKAKEEAERLKKEAEEKVRQETDRVKKEAEEKARQEADKVKREAEEKAKQEAEKAKNAAKDQLKNLFGKPK